MQKPTMKISQLNDTLKDRLKGALEMMMMMMKGW